MKSAAQILKRSGKLDDNDCIKCPICGDCIPLIPGGPEILRHIINTCNGNVKILCPEHVKKVIRSLK